jgi:hypothetical protein
MNKLYKLFLKGLKESYKDEGINKTYKELEKENPLEEYKQNQYEDDLFYFENKNKEVQK